MKNNFDKKITITFIFIFIMIALIFYFLRDKEKELMLDQNPASSDEKTDVFSIEIIKAKQMKIEGLLNDINTIFDSNTFGPYAKGLRSYIDLPLEVGNVGNQYPFGTNKSEEKK